MLPNFSSYNKRTETEVDHVYNVHYFDRGLKEVAK